MSAVYSYSRSDRKGCLLMIMWLIDWLTNRFTDCFKKMIRFNVCIFSPPENPKGWIPLIDWLIDWFMIDWLIYDWLIDLWLIDWLVGWLIDWLIDWLILLSGFTTICAPSWSISQSWLLCVWGSQWSFSDITLIKG